MYVKSINWLSMRARKQCFYLFYILNGKFFFKLLVEMMCDTAAIAIYCIYYTWSGRLSGPPECSLAVRRSTYIMKSLAQTDSWHSFTIRFVYFLWLFFEFSSSKLLFKCCDSKTEKISIFSRFGRVCNSNKLIILKKLHKIFALRLQWSMTLL